jgi:hypothetical protein
LKIDGENLGMTLYHRLYEGLLREEKVKKNLKISFRRRENVEVICISNKNMNYPDAEFVFCIKFWIKPDGFDFLIECKKGTGQMAIKLVQEVEKILFESEQKFSSTEESTAEKNSVN